MLDRVKQHTTINLDPDQVREAADLLGTRGTGETVRTALAEVIRARRRARLLEVTTDLTLDDLRAIREPRFADRP
jgi:Bacterial antitoxin of type II TA system, VapB